MFRDEDRSKVIDLEQIYVQGTNGRVALSNFASLVKGLGPVSVNRENQTRIVHIEADILTNKRANEVEQDIKQAIEDSMILDDSISMTFEGSWKDIGETAVVFLLIVIMALLLVYGVMAGTYESFKDPFINMFTIPLGLIGVIAIYLITGSNLSMFTAFGFVMLVGIAVNNGIILVDQINLLRGRGTAMYDACLDASASRLRPILMSTLTTLLGMFPLAFFPSANGEMLQPIGLCVFGGLLSSSLITLYVIPVLYAVFNRAKRNKEIKPCIEQK
jgi:HAE1 family hydrophobic/amphiphilic exporter-1